MAFTQVGKKNAERPQKAREKVEERGEVNDPREAQGGGAGEVGGGGVHFRRLRGDSLNVICFTLIPISPCVARQPGGPA